MVIYYGILTMKDLDLIKMIHSLGKIYSSYIEYFVIWTEEFNYFYLSTALKFIRLDEELQYKNFLQTEISTLIREENYEMKDYNSPIF